MGELRPRICIFIAPVQVGNTFNNGINWNARQPFPMRNHKALETYLNRYGEQSGLQPDLQQVFRQIRDEFGCRRALYPGCYLHITPSLVFPAVCYVDSLKGITRALADQELLAYIGTRKGYAEDAEITCYEQEYEGFNAEPPASFDLLISLNAGAVSQAAKGFLRPGGLLLANDEHHDARRAFTDPDYRLIGAFEKETLRLATSEEELASCFRLEQGTYITRDMVAADAGRPPSRARFKPAKPEEAYLFRK